MPTTRLVRALEHTHTHMHMHTHTHTLDEWVLLTVRVQSNCCDAGERSARRTKPFALRAMHIYFKLLSANSTVYRRCSPLGQSAVQCARWRRDLCSTNLHSHSRASHSTHIVSAIVFQPVLGLVHTLPESTLSVNESVHTSQCLQSVPFHWRIQWALHEIPKRLLSTLCLPAIFLTWLAIK